MKIKVNLSLLTYIRTFDKNRSNVKKIGVMDWKLLLLGVAIIKNNLYTYIGEEKDLKKINDFLSNRILDSQKLISINKNHREEYFDGKKPSYVFKYLEKLTTSEVVMYHNEENIKCSNLFIDREIKSNIITFKIGTNLLKELYLPKKSSLLNRMNILGDFSLVADDIFKFKNIASYILYIIFSKQGYVMAEIADWNKLLGIKFATKDLINKIQVSLDEIKKITGMEISVEKLDNSKRKIEKKTCKISYLKLTKVKDREEDLSFEKSLAEQYLYEV